MAGPRAGPDWQGLQRGISGQVLLPGSDAYQRAHPPFTAWFDNPEPRAVVRCSAPQDAAEVLAFARRHGLGTATRSGGHSFAGHSCTRGIVIDVTPMAAVVVADGVAEVGAGVPPGRPVPAPGRPRPDRSGRHLPIGRRRRPHPRRRPRHPGPRLGPHL